jgi:hypothetical protein
VSVAFELQCEGFTHVTGYGSGCGLTVTLTFKQAAERLNATAWSMSIEDIQKMTCTDCLDRPALVDVKPIKRQRPPRCG